MNGTWRQLRGRRVGAILLAVSALGAPAEASDPAYGEYLSSACVTCHRLDGADKGIPSIVGWPSDQFITVLKSYKTRERPNQVMQTIAGRLSDDEMAALAAYYGSLKAP
ncbi:MAG: c-type cytochrome [Hyphomicrobiaceae bacterium]|nr:c-type cytochrome [Hyphomicrobiaceae bacterium]